MPVVGDLITIGGNHFVHGSRRNMELTVLCINSFVYEKIAGKSPPSSRPEFSPYSTIEEPFNIPHLGNSCSAVYTARWTALHTNNLITSIGEALNKRGLSVIEVLAPGPNFYNGISNIDYKIVEFYRKYSKTVNNENPRNVEIQHDKRIIVGNFTNVERPTYIDSYNAQLSKILGDRFTPYGPVPAEVAAGVETGGKNG